MTNTPQRSYCLSLNLKVKGKGHRGHGTVVRERRLQEFFRVRGVILTQELQSIIDRSIHRIVRSIRSTILRK